MATKCSRLFSRTSISSIKSSIKSASRPSPSPSSASPLPKSASSPIIPRFSFSSRIPSELGCLQSMLPLHSAIATARMTSCLSTAARSCRALSQDEIDGT